MADKTSKTTSSSVFQGKKKLGTYFDALPAELKASSRRMQVYGELLLNTIMEDDLYPDEPLCSSAGMAALKNALKFYNIGVTLLNEPEGVTTDLDDLSEGYKAHVENGLKLLDAAIKPDQRGGKDALQWQVLWHVLAAHHERWDGGGYPSCLRETEIPLSARICAVCNYLENLTTSNADRDKMTNEAAVAEITRLSEKHFDPVVVEALNRSLPTLNEIIDNGTLAKATAGNASVRAIEQLYRSIYDYGNHTPYGYDTDIRLNDPEMGVISSRIFTPIAERSSRINELCKWSVEEVCNTILDMKKRNRFTGEFFVAMSVKSLTRKNFIGNIVRIVEVFGVQPQEICFVISENIFSFNVDTVATALGELHGAGFKVAIGGFGAEAVNLAVLQKLEVDYLILDPTFVSDVVVSARAKQIVSSVIDLAEKLDLVVIADGVANKQQAKELYTMGCNIMCGSYYGRYTAVSII